MSEERTLRETCSSLEDLDSVIAPVQLYSAAVLASGSQVLLCPPGTQESKYIAKLRLGGQSCWNVSPIPHSNQKLVGLTQYGAEDGFGVSAGSCRCAARGRGVVGVSPA